MKLVVLCLFAVCCFSLSTMASRTQDMRKLREVLRELKEVKKTVQHSKQMLNTPPRDIEDCCSLSALECFRANLNVHFNATREILKLSRSLGHPSTRRGQNFNLNCISSNAESTCQECDMHPKENVNEFFLRLESLIQMAIARMMKN